MDELILKDFRCFPGEQRVPLKPLTVLVGENSTGKTSFLAAVRLAWGILSGPRPQDFAEPPFDLGGYRDIAFHRGTRVAREFVIGIRSGKRTWRSEYAAARHGKLGTGLPEVRRWARTGSGSSKPLASVVDWELQRDGASEITQGLRAIKSGRFSGVAKTQSNEAFDVETEFEWLHRDQYASGLQVHVSGIAPSSLELERELARDLSSDWNIHRSPISIAAMRSGPLRSYRLTGATAWSPDGAHVPAKLAELSDGQKDFELRAINELGHLFGLFDGVKLVVKDSTKQEVEVHVTANGRTSNLVDVGYGVGQALPLAMELALGQHAASFLIQQPEVHLHPRAQAALGSVFGALVKEKKQRFVVETHSDYLIDRVLLDIRDKKTIRAEDFQILYFQWENGGVKIHPIDVDAQGQLVPETVPSGYRSFFLDEQHRVWSR